MKIQLRPLSIHSLCFIYARVMDDKKIRHYSVPFVKTMLGADPRVLVCNHIRKEEPDAEIDFLETSTPGVLTPEEVSLPFTEFSTWNSLRINKIGTILHQYNHHLVHPIWKLVVGKYIAPYYNALVKPINEALRKFQMRGMEPDEISRFDYLDHIRTIRLIPTIPVWTQEDYERRVSSCIYHTVAFEEGDEEIAYKALADDLEIYAKYKAIQGHLSMPSRIQLADTVGSGKKIYAVYCFMFADFNKIPGWNPMTAEKAPSPFPGIRTASYEGGVTVLPEIDYTKRYEIETIKVDDNSEKLQDAIQKAYDESVPAVQKAAAKTRKKIKERKAKKK